MAEKKTYFLRAEVKNVEIRKVEDICNKFNTKDGKEIESHSILLSCDDEDCNRIFFTDRNMENLGKYKRGMIGTFFIRIDVEQDFGTKSKITVVDFKENE